VTETDDLDQYAGRCEAVFRSMFQRARQNEHLQFAMALSPEFRGEQVEGWSTAADALSALDQFKELVEELPGSRPVKVRVALALYVHMSEASGLYECLKNMMRIASGEDYSWLPFNDLVERRRARGAIIAPNSGRVMRDLLAHADELGLKEFKSVVEEAFDAELRNAVAHADYIVWPDGIRLRKRHGGHPRIVGFQEFAEKLNKALNFFDVLARYIERTRATYSTPVLIEGRLNSRDKVMPAIISYDEKFGSFGFQQGFGMDQRAAKIGATTVTPSLP